MFVRNLDEVTVISFITLLNYSSISMFVIAILIDVHSYRYFIHL